MTKKLEKSDRRKKASKKGTGGLGGKRPGAGRKPFSPSIDQRITVERMKFCGESDATIARALRVDVGTLRKHFVDELENGYAHRRKEVIDLMFEAARQGNASMMRRLEEIGSLANPEKKTAKSSSAKPGKKQVQQAMAEDVASAGIFSPPAAPKLAALNGQIVA
jgi:hypothetical protein